MTDFFKDYILHHVGKMTTVGLINTLYDFVGGEDVIGSDIFRTGLHLPQEIIIHLLTHMNKIIWEGVKSKLIDKKLIDYADDQINYFTPSINLETCGFTLNNISDDVSKTITDRNIGNKQVISYVVDNIVIKLQKGDI